MTYPDDIVKGFGTHGKHQIENIEWFFSEVLSTDKKLVFQAYDANLSPTIDFSKWNDAEFRDKQINEALKRYSGRGYDVWLDDVLIWSRLQEDNNV